MGVLLTWCVSRHQLPGCRSEWSRTPTRSKPPMPWTLSCSTAVMCLTCTGSTTTTFRPHSFTLCNSLSLVIGERAWSTGTRRYASLLVTLRARIVRNLFVEYPFSTHQSSNTSHGHLSNSPERATGRRTSPSVHACPTPHCSRTFQRMFLLRLQ